MASANSRGYLSRNTLQQTILAVFIDVKISYLCLRMDKIDFIKIL